MFTSKSSDAHFKSNDIHYGYNLSIVVEHFMQVKAKNHMVQNAMQHKD